MLTGTSLSALLDLHALMSGQLLGFDSAMSRGKTKKGHWNSDHALFALGLRTRPYAVRVILYTLWFHLAGCFEMRAVSIESGKSYLHGPEEGAGQIAVTSAVAIVLSMQYFLRLPSE